MAKGKLFEYAVLFHPKESEDARGNDTTPPSQLLVSPVVVLAGSDKEVAMRAARAVPEKYETQLEQVEIVVRPF